jgi:hypothetical protein
LPFLSHAKIAIESMHLNQFPATFLWSGQLCHLIHRSTQAAINT